MNKNHAQNSSPKILKQSFKKTLLALALASFSTVCAADVQISRVTVNTQGEELNGDVWGKSLVSNTGDVVFASKATNLVDNDVTDNRYDLFLKNQLSGEVEFVNVHSDGTQGESDAYAFNMSPDGNMIVFRSNAYNLTDDPNSFYQHLYLRDRKTNQTLLVSKGFNGQAANGNSYDADVSDDGNFVVFTSNATNLLEQPTNATTSVFLYDRQADTITLVGKNANNEQIDSRADEPTISGDGRKVAYTTAATNLDVRDTNGRTDVYVYDRINNTTELASVTMDNTAAGFGASSKASLSYDGQFIGFRSSARNLVPVNWNNYADIFFRDMNSKTTTLISNSWDPGQTLNHNSDAPDLSPDGRYVTFTSGASNLVEHGHNSNNDGFIHDRLTGTTLLASKGNLGQSPAGNHVVMGVDRSANGRFFVFDSMAPNIVENDPNITLDHFLVDFDTAPTLAITAPGDNTIFVEDELVTFIGSAQDEQDGDISANIQWSSDIDGVLSSSTYLSVGSHVISATITDTADHTEQTAIILIIEEKALEYCAASGIDSANQWIEQIEFAGQQVQSGNNNGYLDNTGNAVIDLTKGENALKLTPGYSGKAYRKKWRVWIDINQDGTFTKNERVYNGRSRKTINSTLTIDSAALAGETRMRVAMRWGKKPKACGAFEYGEVEDYTVNILP